MAVMLKLLGILGVSCAVVLAFIVLIIVIACLVAVVKSLITKEKRR